MRRLEVKNADFRRRRRKIKTNLANVTRKDGAIDFYSFWKRKEHGNLVKNVKVRYDNSSL